MAKHWTDKEINFFKNNYSNHTNLELSKVMNKTIGAIERHATIYQLKKDDSHIKNIRNSKHRENVEYIKNNYQCKTAKQIANDLNLDITIVQRLIYTHGLQKTNNHCGKNKTKKNWTQDEIDFLKENYDILTQEEISSILNRTIKSIQKKMSYLGIKKYIRNDNWSQDEINFLKENYSNVSNEELMNILNRTDRAIRAKAVSLNLYKDLQETLPEKLVRKILVDNNIDFSAQVNIRNFIADFVLNDYKIIIEVQGDYWHCNPNIYKNGPINDIQRKKIKQDKVKHKVYTELGYKIIYIWEQDINNDFNKCTKQILVAVYGQNSQKSIDD